MRGRVDNGHARDEAYTSSLRQYYPYQQYGGRYSNGPVAVEWMVGSASPALAKGSNAVKLIDCESSSSSGGAGR